MNLSTIKQNLMQPNVESIVNAMDLSSLTGGELLLDYIRSNQVVSASLNVDGQVKSRLKIEGRLTYNASTAGVSLRFNNDSTSSYRYVESHPIAGGSVYSAGGVITSFPIIPSAANNSNGMVFLTGNLYIKDNFKFIEIKNTWYRPDNVFTTYQNYQGYWGSGSNVTSLQLFSTAAMTGFIRIYAVDSY